MKRLAVGVDVGGTFTDLIVLDNESGDLRIEKVPTTPADQSVGFMAALDSALSTPAPALVCVMVANNETGVLQPICEIAERVRAHGSLLFCDGVQAAGKIPLSLEDLGCDALELGTGGG